MTHLREVIADVIVDDTKWDPANAEVLADKVIKAMTTMPLMDLLRDLANVVLAQKVRGTTD